MNRCVILLAVISLLAWGSICAQAAETPGTLTLNGYWYYEGFLTDNRPDAGYIAIPNQPVTLYAERNADSPVVGLLPPGQEADIKAISLVAHPGQMLLTVKLPLATQDGQRRLQPGDKVGFVSRYGADAVAVYFNGEIIGVAIEGLDYPPDFFRYPLAQHQWLYLSDRQGLTGWCQVSVERGDLQQRWRINRATAAGGGANFNPIVFGKFPHFQRLPMLLPQGN